MTVITVCNAKGGVGKTTTAYNLASRLAHKRGRTLLIDLDSQASAGLALGLEPAPATYRLLLAGDPLPDLVTEARPGLDILRSDDTLADLRDWLAVRSARNAGSALNALSKVLKPHLQSYAFTVIDSGPGLDILTLNGLMVATDVLVPVSVDFLSAAGTRQHLDTLDGLRKLGGTARLSWIVPTFCDLRLLRAREILEMLERTFGELVTEPIRTNTRLAEAPHLGLTIWEHDPKAIGAEDYDKLVRRVLDDCKA